MTRCPRSVAVMMAAALVLTGCGRNGGDDFPPSPVDSSRVSGMPTTSLVPGQEVDVANLFKTVDAATNKMRSYVEVDVTDLAMGTQTVQGKQSYVVDQNDRANGKLRLSLDNSTEVIGIGSTYYLKTATSNGKYSKTTADALTAQGIDLPDLTQSSNSDQLVAYIKEGSFVGTETAAGVTGRHYRLKVDPKFWSEVSGLPLDDATIAAAQPGDLDMWTNSDDVLVQLIAKLDIGGIKGSVTQTVTEVNKPVSIQAPSADQVA